MKKITSLLLAALLVFSLGCKTSQLDVALNLIPPAASLVMQLVEASGGPKYNAALQQKIEADAQALKKLEADFKAATGGDLDKQAKISAAIDFFQADLAQVFTLAQVSNGNSQGKISHMVGLIASLVKFVLNAIPQFSAGVQANVAGTPPISPEDFKQQFNAELAGTGLKPLK